MRQKLDVEIGDQVVPVTVSTVDAGSYPNGSFGLAENQPGVWSVRLFFSITEDGQTKIYTGRYISLPSPQFHGTADDVRQSFAVKAESTTGKGKKLFIVEKKPAPPAEGEENE